MIQGISSTPATASAPDTAPGTDKAKLKSAAQAFEAVFVRQMISSMRQDGLGDGMFDSEASNTFRDMADGKTADSIASKGVFGIAGMLEKQLGPIAAKAAQAVTNPGAAIADAARGIAAKDTSA